MFFFEDGKAKYGRFYHLTGEEAFWQLFLHEKLSGTFSFSIVEASRSVEKTGPVIRRNATDLLITALQYRDEFKQMFAELPEPDTLLRREKLNLDWSGAEWEDLRPAAETIWQLCYSTELTLEELCPDVPGVRVEILQDRLPPGGNRAFLAGPGCARGRRGGVRRRKVGIGSPSHPSSGSEENIIRLEEQPGWDVIRCKTFFCRQATDGSESHPYQIQGGSESHPYQVQARSAAPTSPTTPPAARGARAGRSRG